MRKMNPKHLRADFAEQVVRMLAYFHRVSDALRGSNEEEKDLSHLSESVFMDGYVLFESFL